MKMTPSCSRRGSRKNCITWLLSASCRPSVLEARGQEFQGRVGLCGGGARRIACPLHGSRRCQAGPGEVVLGEVQAAGRKGVGGKGQGGADHRHQRAFLQDPFHLIAGGQGRRRQAAWRGGRRFTGGTAGLPARAGSRCGRRGWSGRRRGRSAGGRGICMTGTLTTGNFGLLDLMLNSTCWPGGTWNPCGNASMAVKDLPGWSPVI